MTYEEAAYEACLECCIGVKFYQYEINDEILIETGKDLERTCSSLEEGRCNNYEDRMTLCQIYKCNTLNAISREYGVAEWHGEYTEQQAAEDGYTITPV